VNYNITRTKRFIEDLRGIIKFYNSNGNFIYARKLNSIVKETILSLDLFPEKFVKVSNIGNYNIRQCLCERFKIFYQIDGNNIYVFAITGSNLNIIVDRLNFRVIVGV
jgi:hypothetical protein